MCTEAKENRKKKLTPPGAIAWSEKGANDRSFELVIG